MSELLFLGTGAADWFEEENGFYRRHSAALLNGELMLDCGGCIFEFAKSFGSEKLFDTVTDILITHNHSDHFCAESVLKLAEDKKIRVGCDKEIMEQIGGHPNIEFVVFKPFQAEKMGKYEVIPLLANHHIVVDGDAYAFHYIIKTPDGKELFYGLDGAWFLRPSWEEMKKHKFDVMVLDCTVGDNNDWRLFEHNTIPMLRIMVEGIHMENMVAEKGVIVASHLARTLHKPHDETKEILQKAGMLTAYDGMKIFF